MPKKSLPTIPTLLLVSTCLAAIGSAQEAGQKRVSVSDFDLREQVAAQNPIRDRALVERRTRNVESFLAAERARRPGLRVVPNQRGLPKLFLRDGGTLSDPAASPAEEVARAFLRQHTSLFELTDPEIDGLRLVINDAAPSATFMAFNQTVNGIDVFEGQIKFTLTARQEVVQIAMAEVIPGLNVATNPSLASEAAVRLAINSTVRSRDVRDLGPASVAGRKTSFRNPFGAAYSAVTAELCVFPLDTLTGRLAYRIFLETDPLAWYEVLIDAENGALLYRHNLYRFAGEGRVWTQSPMQGSRTVVPFPDTWLPPASTVTTGNNADVYLDSNGDDHPDSTSTSDLQNGRPTSSSQNFDFSFGDGLTGQDPRQSKASAATNLFYFLNTAHDYYYSLGFTESAGAFQTDKFGKGGTGHDAVLGEAQFGGFTNNAAFAPTPEGVAPRIRMGLFTRGTAELTDDLDSDYDGETVIHEYGHGVSNRLVGAGTSTSCLSRIQSGALGEGWSDYFSISFFNNPVEGAYLTQNPTSGIRRQSYEGYTFTYEDVGNAGYEVHNDGEIWAATLWDLRKVLGQSVTDRLVLSGLKSTPCNPSMTDARDALLSADQTASGGAHRAAIWQVFARHGLGYSAVGSDGTLSTGTRYDAASDLPPDLQALHNPAVTSNPLLITTSLGSTYSYTPAVSNPNSGTLSFLLSQGPAGMSVNSATGVTQWTAGFVGQRVKIVVTDGKGGRLAHGYLLPVVTTLNPGIPLIIQADQDTDGLAQITVPAGTPVLQVTLRDGIGDADLSVLSPDGDVEFSGRDGNNETLLFAAPKAGVWQIAVLGYAAYAGVKLTGTLVTPAVLGLNATVSLSGLASSETLFRVPLPAGVTRFAVATSGGTGDVDLFLKHGSPALCQESLAVSTLCDFDFQSTNDGNSESINVTSPAAGDWYIDASGYEDYSGVTLAISTSIPPTLTVAPSTLSFTAIQGAAAPPAQSLSIANPAGSSYTWTAAAKSTGNWLQLGATSGNGDATLKVSVNPTGLNLGSYQGTVTVAAAALAGSPQTLTVTLTVGAASSLVATPSSLAFQTVAAQNPAPQSLAISDGNLGWTAVAATSSGAPWLQVSPASNPGDGSAQVSVSGSGLAPGSYSGTITITASGALDSPLVVPVTLIVGSATPVPTITAGNISGAAGSLPPVSAISPGGFATVKGVNFAPDGTSYAVQSSDMVNGNLPAQLAGTCVDADSLPAFLTYVSPTQINFVVPSVRTGLSVTVQVRTNCGQANEIRSLAASVASQTASPEFLYWAHSPDNQNPVIAVNAVTGALAGPPALLSVLAPAKPGDYLTIYGVSFGPTTPSFAPGTPPAGQSSIAGPVSVQLGTSTLNADNVLYVGVSPQTAGLYQLNIHLPSDLPDGNYPLVLSFGGFSTPAGYLLVSR